MVQQLQRLVTDPAEVRHYWQALTEEGQVYEATILGGRRGAKKWFGQNTGYFDDVAALIKALYGATGDDAEGVFLLPNPVPRHLLARGRNVLKSTKTRTADADVLCRHVLLIDCDSERPSGISATAAEVAAAQHCCSGVLKALQDEFGWPDPLCRIASGNGDTLLFRVDLPNDRDAELLLQRVLAALDARFSGPLATIDTKTFNAARLYRLPGSVNAKGENFVDDERELDRPWRLAKATYFDGTAVVSREQLEAVAATAPIPEPEPGWAGKSGRGQVGIVRAVIAHNNLQVKGPAEGTPYKGNGFKWDLPQCPCDEGLGGACLFETRDGIPGFRCQHDHCQGRNWRYMTTEHGHIAIPDEYAREHRNGASGPEPVVVCFADVKPEPIEWFWHHRIARKKVNLLIGDPGCGKGLMVMDVVARATRGDQLPDDPREGVVRRVLYLAAEDTLADTLVPRAEWLGAEMRHLHQLRAVKIGNEQRHLSLENDLALLKQAIVTYCTDLVIIDPLNSYILDTEGNADIALRRVLTPLTLLAEELNVAVLCVGHLNKDTGKGALYRALGSIGYIGAARCVLGLAADREKEDRRYLALLKTNQAPAATMAFDIVRNEAEDLATITWDPKPVALKGADLFKGIDPDKQTQQEEALDFLQFMLEQNAGRVCKRQILADAKKQGLSETTVYRARKALGLDRSIENGETYWVWPSKTPEDEDFDPEAPWRDLVRRWWDTYHETPVTAAELALLAMDVPSFDFGGAISPRGKNNAFGQALRQRAGRPIGSYVITATGEIHHTTMWQLALTPPGEGSDLFSIPESGSENNLPPPPSEHQTGASDAQKPHAEASLPQQGQDIPAAVAPVMEKSEDLPPPTTTTLKKSPDLPPDPQAALKKSGNLPPAAKEAVLGGNRDLDGLVVAPAQQMPLPGTANVASNGKAGEGGRSFSLPDSRTANSARPSPARKKRKGGKRKRLEL